MTAPAAPTRAVAIGGGHGLSRTLAALVDVVDEVTAVVTVADDGGSSGRLRRDHGVLPPGDLRMALAALARDRDLAELVQYRFHGGELDGHSLGNLIMVALQELEGDLCAGLDRLGRLLAVPGRVRPCTLASVRLAAATADGEVRGQADITATRGIRRVWLEPEAPAGEPGALAAIAAADLVVLGPGSLYTSLLPNLLVPAVADAVRARRGPGVLVANLRQQPGETEGLGLEEHLAAIDAHVGALGLDVLLAHEGPAPTVAPALVATPGVAERVGRVRRADLLADDGGHDPRRLAAALRAVLDDAAGDPSPA